MATFGYGRVPDKGFVAFAHELGAGGWGEIALKKFDSSDHQLSAAALAAPPATQWKLRLTWSLDDLIAALETGSTEALKALDDSWDSCQRRLFHNVGAASEDEDPKIRLAAARVAAALLQGNGLAQTTLPYDEEVDVGRKQVALANSEGLSGDIALLKLEARVEQIDATTEKLADALGRSGGKKRGARSGRVREAMASCAVAFNGVHDDLAWLIDHLPEGKERQGLQALLTPLESLLTRYPATAAAAPEPPAPAEPAPEKKPG